MHDATSIPATGSSTQKRGCTGCLVWLFAIMFLGAGLTSAYFISFRPLWGMFRSQDWKPTPCQIVSSELKHNGESVTIAVVYKYSVNDQEHRSDRFCFCQMNSNTSIQWKQTTVAKYPPGMQTNCYVNPDDPNDAVIERGWVPDMWWGLFPIPFVAVGVAALLAAIGLIRLPDPNAPQGPMSWVPRQQIVPSGISSIDSEPSLSPTHYGSRYGFESGGPVTLKPSSSPFLMLIGSILVSLFWNGIVSFFVWQQVAQFQQGRMGAFAIGTSLFLVPFVLIGLGMICSIFYFLLALTNPRPTITVNSVAIPLGEKLKLSWTLNGSSNSVRKFRINLKGREKATYQRGTTTTTDEAIFADITIFETTDSFDMDEGTREITIPANSMHSFNAPHNKIEWVLEIRGDIPFWPDISAAFPIIVMPHATNS